MSVIGGAEGARTPDLRIANAALCQTELLPHAEQDTTVSSCQKSALSLRNYLESLATSKPRRSLSAVCFSAVTFFHLGRSSIHRQRHCGVKSSASTTRVNGICAFSFTSFTKSRLPASNKYMQCASPGTKAVRM